MTVAADSKLRILHKECVCRGFWVPKVEAQTYHVWKAWSPLGSVGIQAALSSVILTFLSTLITHRIVVSPCKSRMSYDFDVAQYLAVSISKWRL